MIYINDNLRIRQLDKNCLQLEECRTPDKKHLSPTEKYIAQGENTPKWVRCGYYEDLETAFCGALSKLIFDNTESKMTLTDVVSKIQEARADIIKAIGELKNG